MKKLLLLLLLPLMFACGSDDKEEEKPDEKIAVTSESIIGNWEYEDSKTGVMHTLAFKTSNEESLHQQHKGASLIDFNKFRYSIVGFDISIMGMTPPKTYKTQIYKRDGKLYFDNMPFVPSSIK